MTGERRSGSGGATSSGHVPPTPDAPPADGLLEEVEALARIGWYSLDIPAGRWVSSRGLDSIFGIGAAFDRSVSGWASLVHPADREAMLAYLAGEVLGQGQPFDRQYRIVRADSGEERWVHGRGALAHDATGRAIRMFGTIADITDRRRTQEALLASERRYAAIFEGAMEAILIAETGTLRLRWANPAACTLLGYSQDELLGLTIRAIHPARDLPRIIEAFRAAADGGPAVARSVPCLRKDGTPLLTDIKASTVVIESVPCLVGFFSDVTDLRRVEAQERKLVVAVEQAAHAVLITDASPRIEYANPAFEQLSGRRRDELVGGHPGLIGSPHSTATFEAMWGTLSAGEPWTGELMHRRPDGTERIAKATVSPVRDADGTLTGYVAVERDVTAERTAAAERARLAAAVEQTSDSVIITDPSGTIEYVNPAFERVSGYGRAEVTGQNPRILKSGHQSAALYRALWRRLTRGDTWTGTLVNRRKDGTLYEEAATISPLRGPDGRVSGYVGVKRDVTALRAAESDLARGARERAQVVAALARIRPLATAEATAAVICDELLGLPGIELAGVIGFQGPEQAVPLAAGGPDGVPFATGRPLPRARAAYLHERAGQGPWAEVFRPRREDGPYGRAMAAIGVRAIAYAPIRAEERLLGVVAAGTRDAAYAGHLVDQIPAVGEFAEMAGALLGQQLERGHRGELARERVGRALAERGLRPVFQPIIALGSAAAVGYEALTRFADRTPADRMFAEARSVGLGLDLELACLAAALDAAEGLPRQAWLSLNVSPEVLLRTEQLVGLVAGRSRPIVVEITEHAVIEDYAAVRRAIEALGPRVSLAVDDAGAGFASLRHVVELRPKYLKLDIGLVHLVHRDPSRQAMIAGLRHFATRVGCEVIAEGIELPAELAMLRELGVPLGQGRLLGRPRPVRATNAAEAPRGRRVDGTGSSPSAARIAVGRAPAPSAA